MEERSWPWDYEALRSLLRGEALPAMVVDLDVLDANVRRIADLAARWGKTVRVASKSVRVPALLRRILEVGAPHLAGLMCYSVPEAHFLAGLGFDNLLVAYPTVQESDLRLFREMVAAGTDVTLMIDEAEHVERLEVCFAAAGPDLAAPVCIEVDVSYRGLGLHLGVHRSPVRSLDAFCELLHRVRATPRLRLAGVMGYEAQVAGVPDANPFQPLLGPVVRLVKGLSVRDVAAKRRAIARVLEEEGVKLRFFNGGGTGSLATTCREPWVTEVTAGSGFLQSHLFDYYAANRNVPAFAFALQVTRLPEEGLVTCQGGGFVASGATGPDKAPLPFLPAGVRLVGTEGCGEVQTPLRLPRGVRLHPGDPVFFRPAKAGEVAERFDTYLLKQGDAIVDRVPTYRGMGGCFH